MPPIYNELFAAMEQKDVFMFLSELRFGSFFLNLLFTGWCILGVNHFATKKMLQCEWSGTCSAHNYYSAINLLTQIFLFLNICHFRQTNLRTEIVSINNSSINSVEKIVNLHQGESPQGTDLWRQDWKRICFQYTKQLDKPVSWSRNPDMHEWTKIPLYNQKRKCLHNWLKMSRLCSVREKVWILGTVALLLLFGKLMSNLISTHRENVLVSY